MRSHVIAASAIACSLAGVAVFAGSADANVDRLRATLRDPAGNAVGVVMFSIDKDGTEVHAILRPSTYVTTDAFHGLHLHANSDPANGTGCLADASQPSTSWFVSADGHLSEPGQTHGRHDGDFSSPLVQSDGHGHLWFTTDRIDPSALVGRAVVLHAGPDNFGNVPVGSAPDQYLPNSAAATDKTAKTGNAGDRVACGVVS